MRGCVVGAHNDVGGAEAQALGKKRNDGKGPTLEPWRKKLPRRTDETFPRNFSPDRSQYVEMHPFGARREGCKKAWETKSAMDHFPMTTKRPFSFLWGNC